MKHPPTLAPLAAPQGAGQSVGAALPDLRTLEVALAERTYPIHIGGGALRLAGPLLAGQSIRNAIVVTNDAVAAHWLSPLRQSLADSGVRVETVLIPDGEVHKSWATLHDVLTRLLELRADRGTVVVALGGGVVGDIAGFAAAIYQRGVPYLQIPTTLLAQVDSSVGGKTGVNHALGKNMIGAFYQPRAVLIDTDCLRTLPDRELAAGLAEVIKYGAIRDADFFAWLEDAMPALKARDSQALTHAIHTSCRIKAEIVGADEREHGERALLNFGHTFGHAIENGLGYGAWLHGEAVATGMVVAAEVSQRLHRIDAATTQRLRALVARAGLPVTPPALGFEQWKSLRAATRRLSPGPSVMCCSMHWGARCSPPMFPIRSCAKFCADPLALVKTATRRSPFRFCPAPSPVPGCLPNQGLQTTVTMNCLGGVLESCTVTCVVRGSGAGANPVTEKPCPDAGTVVGVIRPTVPATEKNTVYGATPPVITKFDVEVLHVGPVV